MGRSRNWPGPADGRSVPSRRNGCCPWSTVWRVPTDAGPVWFKANASRHRPRGQRSTRCWCVATPAHVLDPARRSTPTAGGCCCPTAARPCARWRAARTDLAAWERMLRGVRPDAARASSRTSTSCRAAGVPDAAPDRAAGDARGTPGRRPDAAARRRGRAHVGRSATSCWPTRPTVRRAVPRPRGVRHPASRCSTTTCTTTTCSRRPSRAEPLRVFDWGDAVGRAPVRRRC